MTRVKVCGLRRPEDVRAANRCLPDYVGFVFAPGSRRRVDAGTAQRLRGELDSRIRSVGVFVNQPEAEIVGLCRGGIIDIIQLHGDEDTACMARLRAETSAQVIRAVAVANTPPQWPRGADYALFDTASIQRGGGGKVFDWSLLEGVAGDYFLAGGLDSGNVCAALERLRPYAVDVSSGVETDGWKDAEKMLEFVNLVRRSQG